LPASGGSAGTAGGTVDGGGSGSSGTGSVDGGGSGGADAGGTGVVGGEGGEASGSGGQGAVDPRPSPGCAAGNATPETYLAQYDGTQVLLPPGYDGSTPFPMMLGFHETNMPSQIRSSFPVMHPLSRSYVVVAPEMRDPGYFEGQQPSTVIPLVDEVLATFCVDLNGLFAVGQGSGGRFLGTVLCSDRRIATAPDVRFTAATIMGAYSNCSSWTPIPLLFVHGVNATESRVFQDTDGAKALGRFRTNSGCETTGTPHVAPTCSSGTVTATCVDFDGCTAPLRHCAHDDPLLGNSGWPCFASAAIFEFFEEHRPR
jgi:hypothetical protein